MSNSERIANERLNADIAWSAARQYRLTIGTDPTHAERHQLMRLMMKASRDEARVQEMIERRTDVLISEYADDPRDDGLPLAAARAQVRLGILGSVTAAHRREARDPHGYMRARHLKLANQCVMSSPCDS